MAIDKDTRFDISKLNVDLPQSWSLGDDIPWDAPLSATFLNVELPFWFMLSNDNLTIEHDGCFTPIAWHDDWHELHAYEMADSRQNCLYRGIIREFHELSKTLQETIRESGCNFVWRKCKTVLSISAKVNSVIVNRDIPRPNSFDLYFRELCRGHIPVVNRLIRAYRLQSYDYFAYEVSPWDVPYWSVRGLNGGCNCCIVPYKEWDGRPVQVFADKPPEQRDYISRTQMHIGLDEVISPGELDLMDSLNLMERGDYAGAIRRVISAVEVILEERLREMISSRFFKVPRLH